MADLDHVLGRSTVLLLLFQGLASADTEGGPAGGQLALRGAL